MSMPFRPRSAWATLTNGTHLSGGSPLSRATMAASASSEGKPNSIDRKRWRVLGFKLLRTF